MEQSVLRLQDWVEDLQKRGKNSFTLHQARDVFKNISEEALSLSLARFSRKNKIISILRGFYLIISPKYAAMGVIPPENFIDGLMKALERPYYVGLLNAAAMQGASHQQPQEYFVFTSLPAMRTIAKNGIKVNFISLVHFPSPDTFEKIKTETGYINISPPALTALDLIYFESKIGGLSRAATVLTELTEQIKPADFNPKTLKLAKVSTIQRLGYILDNVINQKKLADALFTSAQQLHLKFGKIKLDPSCPPEKCLVEKRWNVIVNTTIETDI